MKNGQNGCLKFYGSYGISGELTSKLKGWLENVMKRYWLKNFKFKLF